MLPPVYGVPAETAPAHPPMPPAPSAPAQQQPLSALPDGGDGAPDARSSGAADYRAPGAAAFCSHELPRASCAPPHPPFPLFSPSPSARCSSVPSPFAFLARLSGQVRAGAVAVAPSGDLCALNVCLQN